MTNKLLEMFHNLNFKLLVVAYKFICLKITWACSECYF